MAQLHTRLIISFVIVLFLLSSFSVFVYGAIRPPHGESGEFRYVDSFTSQLTGWSVTGSTPYLSDDDTTNTVYSAVDASSEGHFGFQNTAYTTITSVMFEIEDKKASISGDDYYTVWSNITSPATKIGDFYPAGTSFTWESDVDVTSIFNTQAKVNAAFFYMTYHKVGSTATRITVTCADLYVVGSSYAPSWKNIASYTFTLITRNWLSISTLTFDFLTRQWNLINTFDFTLAIKNWNQIATWQFNFITRGWRWINSFLFTVSSLGWHIITGWTFRFGFAYPQTLIMFAVTMGIGCLIFFLAWRKKSR